MRTLVEVTASWAEVVSVEHDESTPQEDIETTAWAYFADQFQEKAFMRGADINVIGPADDPDEYSVTIRPSGGGWDFVED
jgi:hypothetical protein